MKSRIITLLFSVLLSFTAFSQGVSLLGGGPICYPSTPTVSVNIMPTGAWNIDPTFTVSYSAVPALLGSWDIAGFVDAFPYSGTMATYTPSILDPTGAVVVTITITKTAGTSPPANATVRSNTVVIQINRDPVVTVPNVDVCGGLRPVNLTSSSTGTPSTRLWAAGDGVFTSPGTFNTVYTPGDFDSLNRVVNLDMFVQDVNGCAAHGYGTLFLTTPANAGYNQDNCNTTQAILPGNVPTGFETVLWTFTGTTPPSAHVPTWVLPQTQPVTEVNGLVYGFTYNFDYAIDGGFISVCHDAVSVTPWQLPTVSYAGPDQDLCFAGPSITVTLNANAAVVGIGHWIQAAGPAATINSPLSRNSTVTITASGPYAFQWIIENGPDCAPSLDNVDINVWAPPVIVNPPANIELCRKVMSTPVTGSWTGDAIGTLWYSTGDGYFDNPFLPNTTYHMGLADTSLPNQQVNLTFNVQGHSPCTAAEKTIRVFVDETPPVVITQNITVNLSSSPASGGTVTITTAQINNGSHDASPCSGPLTFGLSRTVFTCADVTWPNTPITVTLTVTDDNNNSATGTATVTVRDVTNPTTVCKNTTVDLNHGGTGSIVAADVDNSSTDNCSITFRSVTPNTFNCGNVGTNNVTLLTKDLSTNSSSCVAVVTVRDLIPPDLTCHNITVDVSSLPALGGFVDITPASVTTSEYDACGIATRVLSRTHFTCADVTWPNTPITITLTLTDVNGNSTQCSPTVTVRDVTNPTATCKNITVDLNHAGTASIVPADVNNGSTDNCSVTLTSVLPNSFTCANFGPNTVTLKVTDPSTNSNTCTSTVTVRDLVPPDVTCRNITVNLSSGPPAGGTVTILATDLILTDFDACGIATRTLSRYTFNCGDIFAPVDVLVTVTDIHANTSTCHAFVTVKDITAPTITACPSPIAINTFPANPGICGALVTYAPITWTDNCSATSALVSGQNSGTIFPVGTTLVKWEVTDLAGNKSTCQFNVVVTDNEPPLIICPPDILDVADPGVCYATLVINDPFVSDNCPLTPPPTGTSNTWSTCPSALPTTDPVHFPVGTHIVTWHALDNHGNSSTCTQTITVNDLQPPTIITCPAPRTKALNAAGPCTLTVPTIDLPLADVWDNCGIATIAQSPVAGTQLSSAHGMTHNVTMIVTDIHGNSSTCIVVVTAQDATNPTALCKNITVTLNSAGAASIVPADVNNGSYDNCVFSVISVSPSSFTCSNVGANTVTLLVRDAANNSATCTSTVTVRDLTAPAITCKNITVDLDINGNHSIVGDDVLLSATDACGIATKIPTPSTFTCANVGTPVSVNVVVTDVNGNSSACIAMVTVRDLVPPTITCQNITVNLDATGNATIVGNDVLLSKNDACGIATKIPTPSTFTCANVGANTVNVVVTDVNGNSSACTATVTVRDVTAPAIVCKNITVNLNGSGSASIVGNDVLLSATDACGISTRIATPSTFSCADIATSPRPVTVVVTDINGNSSSCVAFVTVKDLIPPVVTCHANMTLCSVPNSLLSYTPVSGIDPTITDNCTWTYTHTLTGATSNTGAGTASGLNFNVGLTHVLYTVTDQGGNIVTCGFDVNVYQYQQATAGPDLDFCNAANAYLLGNIYNPLLYPGVIPVTYSWIQVPVSGTPAATIYQVENEAVADALVPGHIYKFEFTMAYGPCVSKDTMTIFNWAPPTPSLAGFDQNLCNASSVTLNANNPTVGQGTWIQNAGPAVTIPVGQLHLPNAVLPLPSAGQYSFIWQIANGMCPPENDEVVVTNYAPVAVNAGAAFTLCPTAPFHQLTGTSASNYSTLFWQATGTGYFSDVTAIAPKYYPSASDVTAGTVTLMLTGYGNGPCSSAMSTMVLTINDFIAPTITCPANVNVNADAGVCYAAVVALGTPVTADNCLVASVVNNHPAQYPVGNTTVMWTVTDGKGNTATCNQTVTVVDNQLPVITCPANVTLNTSAGLCTAPASLAGTATATDNCPGVVVTSNAPSLFPKGVTSVIWTATDSHSLTATCTQTVTVVDNQVPVIACPANKTVNTDLNLCTASAVALGTATATDNCPGVVVTNNGPTVYPKGLTTVTWTATDAAGLTATCTQTVTVNDVQPPVITCPANATANTGAGVCTAAASSFTLGIATATDNCPGLIAITNNAPTTYPKGVTNVTWTATDVSGVSAVCIQTVTVLDNQNPTILCHSNVTQNTDLGVCSALITGIAPTVADNCPGVTYTYSINGGTAVAGPLNSYNFPKGTTTVSFVATDLAARTATCSFTVLIKDMRAPVITCPPLAIYASSLGMCGAVGLVLDPPTVVDNCSAAGSITITNNAPYFYIFGNNYVTWTATDQAGNVSTCTQVVEVIDTQAPVVNCPANVTVTINPGQTSALNVSIGTATATDNCWVVGAVTNNHPLTSYNLGVTLVTWRATDGVFNTGTCVQTVTVVTGVGPAGSVSGRFSYVNAEQTALNNEPVTLTQNGSVIATSTTDVDGNFYFTDVPTGTYTLEGASTAPWGGSNATDALIIMKHFTQVVTLLDLPKEAGDVNANGFINSLDALYVAKRFVNQISSFPSGDWTSSNSTVEVGNVGVQSDLGAICYGDVNASYLPPFMKPAPTVSLSTEGVKYISQNETIELPVYTNSSLNTGAISLVINYPANLFDVTGVKLADVDAGNLVYNAQNGELRIAWYNNIPSIFNSNEAVILLTLKAKATTEGQIALSVDGSSEIANGSGLVEMANLTIPKLAFTNTNFNVNVYPNPFRHTTEFTYTLPVDGNVTLKIYDMIGNEVSNIINGVKQSANTYKVTFDGSTLKQGVYTYKLTATSANGDQVKVGKMVITK